MRWVYRTVLFFIFLLLLFLAARPYLPNLEKEWEMIVATWKNLREERAKGINEYPEPKTADANKRERTIAAPTASEPPPAQAAKDTPPEAIDPFIREARERAKKDPEAAMQWLQEQSIGAERLRGMLEVVALWAAKDSESAMLWLESNAQGLARLETLNSGVELWAKRDPQAAAGWIDGMANDQSKIAAAKSLASTWAKTNPTAASEWLNNLPNGPVREEAASALALSWMETDPQSAVAWVSQQNALSGRFNYEAVRKLTSINPITAETFVRSLPTDPFKPNYVSALIAARTENDPYETLEWLSNLGPADPINKTSNYASLMQVWTETDSIAASSWLSEQPTGPVRDAAIVGFSESIQRFEPEAAAAWANTISDPEQRLKQVKNSIRKWAQSNPDDALQWVINSELEPSLQEQIARDIGSN